MRLPTVQKRNAFTLVELLVVIAIIAILMALTVGVMSKVFNYLDEVKVVTEVGRLAQGCEQFKSTFGRYPPAKIILCENPAQYGVLASGPQPIATLASFSSEYLSSVFPGLLTNGSPPALINWTGRGGMTPLNATNYLLEGEESLVYFLSGPRANNAPIGFNTDKSLLPNPSTGARLGPFFEFEPSRVVQSTINPLFHVYRDVFGTAYAYFYARSPGMNNYWYVGAPIFQGTGLTAAQQELVSDCPILTRRIGASSPDFGYVPLWQSTVGTAAITFFKGDSYQIVSAGKDKLFGCGGRWNQADPENSAFGYMNFPAPIATPVADLQATYDNITNVSNGRIVPK